MKRIYGIETEYGLTYSAGSGRHLGPEETARYLFKPVVSRFRSSNAFLANGGRLYLDVGSHPEYATAECSTLDELIAQEEAGTLLLTQNLETAQRELTADGLDGTAHMLKNNRDSAGNSFGSHENFLVRRTMDFTRLTTSLLPFLVVRQLIAGAGCVIPARASTDMPAADSQRASLSGHATKVEPLHGDIVYGLSGRSDVMWEGVSSATTRSRPIINARDEPHADAEKYRRLHVIVGDSSMSQTTTELKVGSAGLVLDLLETGVPLADHTLRNPIRDIRTVARDLTGTAQLELRSGETTTPLELLGFYWEHAQKLADRGDHSLGSDETAQRVLDRWKRVLEAVESGDFSSVDTEIDWVIKKKLFDRYLERGSLSLKDPKITRLDYAYHDVTPGIGLFPKLEQAGLAKRAVPPEDSQRAMSTPPQSTRAKLRGEFIAQALEHRRDFTVDWVHLRLNDQTQKAVVLRDPFATEDDRARALTEALAEPVI
ncbi:Pup--protein ligase [Brevibacterium ravenspurgense]|uniref:Pup--protein ligase n=1 Tax=Brevibacterium ravenspurgense TaxID=479117 RepID=UPI0007867049|nr:Pup--protein ligase [Brevibacterium ravenspurgense]